MQNDSPDAGNMISVTWWEKILCYNYSRRRNIGSLSFASNSKKLPMFGLPIFRRRLYMPRVGAILKTIMCGAILKTVLCVLERLSELLQSCKSAWNPSKIDSNF